MVLLGCACRSSQEVDDSQVNSPHAVNEDLLLLNCDSGWSSARFREALELSAVTVTLDEASRSGADAWLDVNASGEVRSLWFAELELARHLDQSASKLPPYSAQWAVEFEEARSRWLDPASGRPCKVLLTSDHRTLPAETLKRVWTSLRVPSNRVFVARRRDTGK